MSAGDRLVTVLGLLELHPKISELRPILRRSNPAEIAADLSRMSREAQSRVTDRAAALAERGVSATFVGHPTYPVALQATDREPPVLFYSGEAELFSSPSVGMCGSRNVSPIGLTAATACGNEVAAHGLTVVSGYAKGVDTATHLAALESGGRTIIVLAEGIDHFRVKRVFRESGFDESRVLVVSQFAPSQRWNVGAAMTRNGVIAALGRALVVIEAGESGGTLDAGTRALQMGKPVIALEFESQDTPAGNRALIDQGAIAARSRHDLGRVLDALAAVPADEAVTVEQLSLM